jgi:hypothetical protein
LYNGAELPNIDTVWTDKDRILYATIINSESSYTGIQLYLSSVKVTYSSVVNSYRLYSAFYRSYTLSNGQWKIRYDYTNTKGNHGFGTFEKGFSPQWANHNILNADGSTYLEASDPVPVESYPYHVLVFDYGAKESDWYQVHLYYSATAFTYDGSVATNTGTVFWRVYGKDSEAWTDAVELTMAPTLSPGLKDGVYQRIYTNHDILDGEGTVWLAADSVTPVEETEITAEWIESFKLGLALGLCGKSLYIPVVPPAYVWDENTGQLIVNRDNGSLHFEFDQNTFNMTVIQQY